MKPKGNGAAKARNSTHKPLRGKRLYIDVPNSFSRAALRKLVNDFTLLGACVEEFFTQDVKYLITACVTPDVCRAVKGAAAYPSSASPFSCATAAADSPNAADSQRSPLPSASDSSRTWRGRAILAKAHQASAKGNLIDLAKQWQINIVHVDDARKWIEKEKEKLPASTAPASSSGVHSQKNPASGLPSTPKQKALVPPFVKLEDGSQPCRPVYQILESWPILNFNAPEGACPFNNTAPVSNERGKGRKRCKGLDTSIQASGDTGSVLQSLAKRTGDASYRRIKNIGGKTGKASKEVAVCEKLVQETESKKPGYCECCKEKYADINEHLGSAQHRGFASNASNYTALDLLIAGGPNMEQFLDDVLKYHGAHASEGPETAHRPDDCGNEPAMAISGSKSTDGDAITKAAEARELACNQKKRKPATKDRRRRANVQQPSIRKRRSKPAVAELKSSSDQVPAAGCSRVPEFERAEEAAPPTKKLAVAAATNEDEAALMPRAQHATDTAMLVVEGLIAEQVGTRNPALPSPQKDREFQTVDVVCGLAASADCRDTNDNVEGHSTNICYSTVEIVRTVSPKRDHVAAGSVIGHAAMQQTPQIPVNDTPVSCFRKPKQRQQCRKANAIQVQQDTCAADADVSLGASSHIQNDANAPTMSVPTVRNKKSACNKKGRGGTPLNSIQRLKLKEHWQALSRRNTWHRSLSEGDTPLSYYDGYSDFPTDVSYEDVSEVDIIVHSSAYSWVFGDKRKELRDVQKELSVIDKSVKTFTCLPESCLDDYEAFLHRRVAALKQTENHMLLTPSPKKRSRLSLSSRYNPFLSNTFGKTVLRRRRIFSDTGSRSCFDLSLLTQVETGASDQLHLLSMQREAPASLEESFGGSFDVPKHAVSAMPPSCGMPLQQATALSSFDKAVASRYLTSDLYDIAWEPLAREASASDSVPLPVQKSNAVDPGVSRCSFGLETSPVAELPMQGTSCPCTVELNAPSQSVITAKSLGSVTVPEIVARVGTLVSTNAVKPSIILEQCGKPSSRSNCSSAEPAQSPSWKRSLVRFGSDPADAGLSPHECDYHTYQKHSSSPRSISPAVQESYVDRPVPPRGCPDRASLVLSIEANSCIPSTCCPPGICRADRAPESDCCYSSTQKLTSTNPDTATMQPEGQQSQLDEAEADRLFAHKPSNPVTLLHCHAVPALQVPAQSDPEDAVAMVDAVSIIPPALPVSDITIQSGCQVVDYCATAVADSCRKTSLDPSYMKPLTAGPAVCDGKVGHSNQSDSLLAVARCSLGTENDTGSNRAELTLVDIRSSSVSQLVRNHGLTTGVDVALQRKHGGHQGTCCLSSSSHEGKIFKSNSRLPKHFDLGAIVSCFTKKKTSSIPASQSSMGQNRATKDLTSVPTDPLCMHGPFIIEKPTKSLKHLTNVGLSRLENNQGTGCKLLCAHARSKFPSSPKYIVVPSSSKQRGARLSGGQSRNAVTDRGTKLTCVKSRQVATAVSTVRKYRQWQQASTLHQQQQDVPALPNSLVPVHGQCVGGDGLCDHTCGSAAAQKFSGSLHHWAPGLDKSGNHHMPDMGGSDKSVQCKEIGSPHSRLGHSGVASPPESLPPRADKSTLRQHTISRTSGIISSPPAATNSLKESAGRSRSLEQLAWRLNDASPSMRRPLASPRRAKSGEHAHKASSSGEDFEDANVCGLNPSDRNVGSCHGSAKQARAINLPSDDAFVTSAVNDCPVPPTDVSFSRTPKSAKRYLYAKIGQTSSMKSTRHTPNKASANRSPVKATTTHNQMSGGTVHEGTATVFHYPNTGNPATCVTGSQTQPRNSLPSDSISRKLKEMQYDYVSDDDDDPYFPNF